MFLSSENALTDNWLNFTLGGANLDTALGGLPNLVGAGVAAEDTELPVKDFSDL